MLDEQQIIGSAGTHHDSDLTTPSKRAAGQKAQRSHAIAASDQQQALTDDLEAMPKGASEPQTVAGLPLVQQRSERADPSHGDGQWIGVGQAEGLLVEARQPGHDELARRRLDGSVQNEGLGARVFWDDLRDLRGARELWDDGGIGCWILGIGYWVLDIGDWGLGIGHGCLPADGIGAGVGLRSYGGVRWAVARISSRQVWPWAVSQEVISSRIWAKASTPR